MIQDRPATTAPAMRAFYAEAAGMTAPGRHQAALEALPRDTAGLMRVVQGLALHQYLAFAYDHRVPEARLEESHFRAVPAMLDRVLTHDPASLSTTRPVEKRLVGVCHHHVMLLVAMLRAHGMPARARVGFGSYFNPGYFEGHWICEWWDEGAGRWKLADPQFDATCIGLMKVDHDVLDVPRDRFLIAAEAWMRCRRGEADPERFGIFQGNLRGLWFIAGDLVRDLACLNKQEMLPWDVWGVMPRPDAVLSRDELVLFDNLAALTADPDLSFDLLRRFYVGDDRVRVPEMLFNGVRQAVERVAAR